MFKGDRGLILAIVGWLAFAGFISWDSQQQHMPPIHCEATADGRECRPQQYLTERAGVPGTVERAISNPEPRAGQDHEKRDLAAQEASAVWAFWMTTIAGFSALVTLTGTILLYQQIKLTREAVRDTADATKAMRAANELAEANSHRELRAYLAVNSITLDESDTDHRMSLLIQIKNAGQTPAVLEKIVVRAQWVHTGDEDSGLVLLDHISRNSINCHRDTPMHIPFYFDADQPELEEPGMILVFGHIKYRDVFNKTPTESFSFQTQLEMVPLHQLGLPTKLAAFSAVAMLDRISEERKRRKDPKGTDESA